MHLAFVSIEDPRDPQSWSGTSYFMLQSLREAGMEIEVIAPLKRTARYFLTLSKLAARLRGQGIQLDRHPRMLRSYARQVEQRLDKGQFDAVFTPSSIPISYLRPGLPVVMWADAVFEAMAGYYPGSFRSFSRKESALAHQQEKTALERISFAVYSSRWAADAVRAHYGVPEEKLRVVRFGANLPIEHTREDVEGMVGRRQAQDCRLLFIGVDWERKGGPIALETVRILRERGVPATLVVAGCPSPPSPYVENLGFISKRTVEGQRRLSDLFSQSSLFLLPTRSEAAGIVFCEASAFGLPVISTATGGVEDYVRENVNGYCLPPSAPAEAYADRIQSILQDQEQYRSLCLRAYGEYLAGLNWKTATSQIVELLEHAASKPLPCPSLP